MTTHTASDFNKKFFGGSRGTVFQKCPPGRRRHVLDSFVRPGVRVFGKERPAFLVFGYIGLVLSLSVTFLLGAGQGLLLWAMCGLAGTGVLTLLGLAMATKIITGEEGLIYYHHEIAIMIMGGIFLSLANQPLLPYLDLNILGIGIFMACGRIGCLMVGCCHGRPHRLGVCYREEHAEAGFTDHYVGVRLFPIQLVESLWVFGVVGTAILFILGRSAPGEAMVWYIIMYDIGRFTFEFFRGDPERPYYFGFSEGQWISLILMFVVVWAEFSGLLIFHSWHVAATGGMVMTMLIIALVRKFRGGYRHRLLNPRHVREIAEAVDLVSGSVSEREVIPMVCTSLGVRISSGKIEDVEASIDHYHYAFSFKNGTMNKEIAETLAGLVVELKHPSCSKEVVTGNHGVFHILIHSLPLDSGGNRYPVQGLNTGVEK